MNANDGHLSLSWKERSLALELEKDVGGMDTRSTNGEVSVMWASSQGGCDPLKRLLRNVESEPSPKHSLSFQLILFILSLFYLRYTNVYMVKILLCLLPPILLHFHLPTLQHL